GLARLNDSGIVHNLALPLGSKPPFSCDFPNENETIVTHSTGAQWLDLSTGRVLGSIPLNRGRRGRFDPGQNVFLTASLDGLQSWPIERYRNGIKIGVPKNIAVREGVVNEALELSRDH